MAVSGATQILLSIQVSGIFPVRFGFQPACPRGLCSCGCSACAHYSAVLWWWPVVGRSWYAAAHSSGVLCLYDFILCLVWLCFVSFCIVSDSPQASTCQALAKYLPSIWRALAPCQAGSRHYRCSIFPPYFSVISSIKNRTTIEQLSNNWRRNDDSTRSLVALCPLPDPFQPLGKYLANTWINLGIAHYLIVTVGKQSLQQESSY